MLANDKPGIIEKIMMKIFSRFDIVKMVDGEESLYLRRFHLIKRNKLLKFLTFGKIEGMYLHHIMRPDEDRHLHSHPWNFKVLILKGGYTEEIPAQWTDNGFALVQWREGMHTIKRRWKSFSFRSQKAEQLHRICKEDFVPTWTLFFPGPRIRTWGFMEKRGETPYYEYLSKWCPEQMKPTNDPTRIDTDA